MNLHGATHEGAAAALKAAGNNVELVLRYAPEGNFYVQKF